MSSEEEGEVVTPPHQEQIEYFQEQRFVEKESSKERELLMGEDGYEYVIDRASQEDPSKF